MTTAYQGTRNISQATRDAARTVVDAIGARHHELDIEDINNQYTAMIEQAIGRPLGWETDDIALQNIAWALRGFSLPRFHEPGRELPFLIEYDEEEVAGLNTLKDLSVYTGTGPITNSNRRRGLSSWLYSAVDWIWPF